MSKKNVHISMRNPNGKPFATNIEVDHEMTEQEITMIGVSLKEQFVGSKNLIVQYEVFNSISETWMCMCSYYADEKRFVKHE